MSELCKLHPTTGVGAQGEYLTPDVDNKWDLVAWTHQPCRIYGVSYEQFGEL